MIALLLFGKAMRLIRRAAHLPTAVMCLGAVLAFNNGLIFVPHWETFSAPSVAIVSASANPPNCGSPANLVVAENCLPGSTDWIVKTFSNELNGFASPSSVNLGDTVNFYVSSRSSSFSIAIYRIGYYQGNGGRLVSPPQTIPGKTQPDCYNDLQTGLTSCSNWTRSTSMTVANDWVSGIYIAKLSDRSGENFALFTVRDDARKSAILYQQSLFTTQAYNNFAGKSVYDYNSVNFCTTGLGLPRAVKVSFNRPWSTDKDMALTLSGNSFFHAEYGMVRWLESQGYDVTYSNTLDTHRSGKVGARNKLLDHQIFMSSGHDEYWSQEMRNAITAARDAGVNIAFLSGNTAYWRVRLEPDPLTGEPDSVMTIYKTTQGGPPDPSGQPTTTWRDRQGVNDPENGLLGTEYVGDNDLLFFPLQVTATEAQDRLYRHTGLSALPPHTSARIGDQINGWEWDAVVENSRTPAGLDVLASSPVFGFLLQDDGDYHTGILGTATAQVTRYQAKSGALVFSVGTILWSWGLGTQGLQITPIDPTIQQITYNALADMGVQPATPASTLILDKSSMPDPSLSGIRIVPDNGLPPIISNIWADADVHYGSVTFTWDTDVPTIGQVWLGDTPAHTTTYTTPLETFTRSHSLTTSFGTTFDHVFYFRIASMDQDGHITISDVRGFGTGLPSLRTIIHDDLDSANLAVGCWLQANPTGSVGIGGGLGVAVILCGLLTVRTVRNNRRN